jgi:hypothetical protein
MIFRNHIHVARHGTQEEKPAVVLLQHLRALDRAARRHVSPSSRAFWKRLSAPTIAQSRASGDLHCQTESSQHTGRYLDTRSVCSRVYYISRFAWKLASIQTLAPLRNRFGAATPYTRRQHWRQHHPCRCQTCTMLHNNDEFSAMCSSYIRACASVGACMHACCVYVHTA